MDEKQQLYASFEVEAWESLAAIEQLAIGLKGPRPESVAHTLRVFCHRLKGSASILGFSQIASLASHLEALVALTGAAGSDTTTDELLTDAVSALTLALQETTLASKAPDLPSITALLQRLQERVTELQSAQESGFAQALANVGDADAELTAHGADTLHTFRRTHSDVLSYFAPEATEHIEGMIESLADLEEQGPTKDIGLRLFRQVHTLKGGAFTVGCNPMGELAHRMEDLLVFVRKGQATLTPEVVRRLSAGVEGLRAMLEVVNGRSPVPSAGPEPGHHRAASGDQQQGAGAHHAAKRSTIRVSLSHIDGLLAVGGELVLTRGRMEGLVEHLDAVGEQLTDSRKRMLRTIRKFEARHLSPTLQQATDNSSSSTADRGTAELTQGRPDTVSVQGSLLHDFSELEFDRYDDFNILARRVGEIASDLAEINQGFGEGLQDLRSELAKVRTLTQDLRSRANRVRMVQIGGLFKRFSRLAAKLAQETNKSVRTETVGDTVEIDGELVEHIVDPLLHLVSNAVVHGIEDPKSRQAAGKPAHGTVSLKAHSDGQFIHLEVEDDGCGIDGGALCARAIEQNLIVESDVTNWSAEKLVDLIYLPGLSILDEATTSAGRGVGMDVVRRNLEQVGGRVRIETARESGTRFILRLPLTLVTSEALILRVGEERLGVPVRDIVHITAVTTDQLERNGDVTRLTLKDDEIDAIELAEVFGLRTRQTGDSVSAISIDLGDRVLALIADAVVGIEEVVFHPLGNFLGALPGFSSFAMSAATGLVLVLKPAALAATEDEVAFGSSTVHRPRPDDTLTIAAPRSQHSILLADDSISVRKIVGGMLERAGFNVVSVRDGQEALDAVRQQRFDILLTDLEMPQLSGYELIDAIRRRPASRDLPIVVLTTRVGQRHAELARQLGISGYCAKPVDKETLLSLLATLTGPTLDSSESVSDEISHV